MATRQDLRQAYDAVKAKDINAAVDAVAKVTGQNFLNRVPDEQIDAVIRELKAPRSLSSIHNSLDTIRKKAFGSK